MFLKLKDFSEDFVIDKIKLKDIANESIAKNSTIFIQKRIKLNIDFNEDKTVVIDKKWCGFIIEQLVSNAVKYSNRSGF